MTIGAFLMTKSRFCLLYSKKNSNFASNLYTIWITLNLNSIHIKQPCKGKWRRPV